MSYQILAIAVLAVGLASALLTWVVLQGLTRFEILDRPNERSSHAVPTPRGGGLGLMFALLSGWIVFAGWMKSAPTGFTIVVLASVALAVVSWLDDLRGLSAGLRLFVQGLAVTAGIYAIADGGAVFQGLLPPLLDAMAAALLWLWFVNLFNFMDGIDGISGCEAISIAIGLALLAAAFAIPWLGRAGQAAWLLALFLPAMLAAAPARRCVKRTDASGRPMCSASYSATAARLIANRSFVRRPRTSSAAWRTPFAISAACQRPWSSTTCARRSRRWTGSSPS